MKQFLINIALFSSFFGLILIAVGRENTSAQHTADFMDALIDKHNILDKTTTSPRVIFVGGSNLAFGMDSKRVQDSIGLPVVNLGLHAGLGLEFMLNDVKTAVKPNDIVILSIEYFLEAKGYYRLQKLAARNFVSANNSFSNNYYTDVKAYFNEELPKNLSTNFSKLYALTSTEDNSIYSRNAFNEYGDVVRHLEKPVPEKLKDRIRLTYRHWEGIKLLNEFADYAKAHNFKTYFLYPAYPSVEFESNKGVISKYATDMSQELNIPILNKPEDFVLSDNSFFDSVYHLNKKGRERRTNLTIEIIKNHKIY